MKNGIVTRAVLYDMARLKGVPYLEPGTRIYVEDLEAWEKKTGVKVGPGRRLDHALGPVDAARDARAVGHQQGSRGIRSRGRSRGSRSGTSRSSAGKHRITRRSRKAT